MIIRGFDLAKVPDLVDESKVSDHQDLKDKEVHSELQQMRDKDVLVELSLIYKPT